MIIDVAAGFSPPPLARSRGTPCRIQRSRGGGKPAAETRSSGLAMTDPRRRRVARRELHLPQRERAALRDVAERTPRRDGRRHGAPGPGKSTLRSASAGASCSSSGRLTGAIEVLGRDVATATVSISPAASGWCRRTRGAALSTTVRHEVAFGMEQPASREEMRSMAEALSVLATASTGGTRITPSAARATPGDRRVLAPSPRCSCSTSRRPISIRSARGSVRRAGGGAHAARRSCSSSM